MSVVVASECPASSAAVGVATHEAGHAIQHARHYAPLWVRSALVPTANIGSSLGYFVMLMGLGQLRRSGCARVDSAKSRSSVCCRRWSRAGRLRRWCREHGLSEGTYYRWKAKYGGMDVNEARRLKELELENRRLKAALADVTLDKQALKEALQRKW